MSVLGVENVVVYKGDNKFNNVKGAKLKIPLSHRDIVESYTPI